MKSTYLIFAVYIFLLALYPCRDSDMNVDEVKGATAVLIDHDHSHSGEETDICAPFCMCSCCAANIQLVHIDHIETEEPTHNTLLITRYIERPMLDPLSSIWQPPRA